MDIIPKNLSFLKKRVRIYILPLFLVLFLGIFLSLEQIKKVEAEDQFSLNEEQISSNFLIVQGNSLQSVKNPLQPEKELLTTDQIEVVVTGYSSTIDQTDLDPFITARGTLVREGIVATNILPFGTRVKLPELFGDRIFVVEDRMSPTKKYHIDIWFPSRGDALQFGAKITYLEILES